MSQSSYYGRLRVDPSASVVEIRQAYRELSKEYHPDTTKLPPEIAVVKFQQLKEAYEVLVNPSQRLAYNIRMGYHKELNERLPPPKPYSVSSSDYLDASDRPLSSGEIFVLFILGVTLVVCLVLAIAIGLLSGDRIELINEL